MNPHTLTRRGSDRGFTLIELLVAVIIIGILSSIAVPVYLNQRDKASKATTRANVRNIIPDIVIARENTKASLGTLMGTFWSLGECPGTDTILLVTDPGFPGSRCGIRWLADTQAIANGSGASVTSIRALLTDGWGRPLMFNANEGEAGHGGCGGTAVDDVYSTGGADKFFVAGKMLSWSIPLGGFC